ncbi:MAG: hypothetical protein K2Y71_20430 [Xanthobacteraceae bacterium]|nr:hypothetical protein [Xanthobacteraceae bacterium]
MRKILMFVTAVALCGAAFLALGATLAQSPNLPRQATLQVTPPGAGMPLPQQQKDLVPQQTLRPSVPFQPAERPVNPIETATPTAKTKTPIAKTKQLSLQDGMSAGGVETKRPPREGLDRSVKGGISVKTRGIHAKSPSPPAGTTICARWRPTTGDDNESGQAGNEGDAGRQLVREIADIPKGR